MKNPAESKMTEAAVIDNMKVWLRMTYDTMIKKLKKSSAWNQIKCFDLENCVALLYGSCTPYSIGQYGNEKRKMHTSITRTDLVPKMYRSRSDIVQNWYRYYTDLTHITCAESVQNLWAYLYRFCTGYLYQICTSAFTETVPFRHRYVCWAPISFSLKLKFYQLLDWKNEN